MSKLYFRYGAMNCGKTSALLQVAHNYEERGMRVLLMKPSTDTKGSNKVTSRIGLEREVDILLAPNDNIKGKITLSGIDAIIVDEAQFLTPKQVDELYAITKEYNIPILCYGLRADFKMIGFPGSTRLLEIADDIEELKTVCRCGAKATQNLRRVKGEPVFDGDQVVIDGSDNVTYESVCGKCYLRMREAVTSEHSLMGVSKQYMVMMQDEWNNLYYLGLYKELQDALPDVNEFLEVYDVSLEELSEYPSTLGTCFDTEVEIDGGVIMVRGFVMYV